MNLNDNRLIIKTLKSGDQKVFSLVYASYYKPLCLFCSSYVSLEEAEEIVQDLMMYVWEKRGQGWQISGVEFCHDAGSSWSRL